MPTPTNQFRLKLQPNTAYNFSIDWGDGSREVFASTTDVLDINAGISHTYTSGGVKLVSITENVVGGFPKPYFDAFRNTDANNDARKVTKITQWGRGRYSDLAHSFAKATNLQITAIDANTSTINQITSLNSAFYDCTNLTSFPSNFDTSNVTDFNSTWYNCSNITNFPLLNMNKMTDGTNCFFNVKIPTETYSQLLINLAANNLNTRVPFFAGNNTNYFASAQNAKDLLTRSIALGGREWNIQDGGLVNSLRLIKTGQINSRLDQFNFFTSPAGLTCGTGCYDKTELFGSNNTVTLDYTVTPSPTCPTPNVFYSTSRTITYQYQAGAAISMVGNGLLDTGQLIELAANSGLSIGAIPSDGTPYQSGTGLTITYKDLQINMAAGNITVTANILC